MNNTLLSPSRETTLTHNSQPLCRLRLIRVVLIEEDELKRAAMRIALRHQRHQVRVVGEASTARQGLKLVTEHQPDVAIVSISLPDLDQAQLMGQIRWQQRAIGATKIMLSLNNHQSEVLSALKAGADSYCLKTAAASSLLKAIHTTSTGQHWIDPAIAGIILDYTRQILSGREPGQATINIARLRQSQNAELVQVSEREREVLQLIVDGKSNSEIASSLYITVGTVKTHVRNILNKLCVDDRTQAAVVALRTGLIA